MTLETIKNRLNKHFTRDGLIQICEQHEITLPKKATKNTIIEVLIDKVSHKKLRRIVSFPNKKRITLFSILGVIGVLAGIYVDLPEVFKSVTGKKNSKPKIEEYSRIPHLDIENKYFSIYVDSLTNKCQYANKYLYLDTIPKKDLGFEEFAKIGKNIKIKDDGLKVDIVNLGETIAKEIKYRWIFDFDEFREAYSKYDTLIKINIKKSYVSIREESCNHYETFSNNLYDTDKTRYLQPISTMEKRDEIILPHYFIKLNSIYYNYVERNSEEEGLTKEHYIPKIKLETKFKNFNDVEIKQEFEVYLRQISLIQSFDESQMIRLFELKKKIR